MKKLIIVLMLVAGMVYGSTNEIQTQVYLTVSKNALQISRVPDSLTVQMAGTKFNSQIIAATTTNQALTKGSVANMGWCYLQNLSTNTSVYFSVLETGFTTNMLLKAREFALFRFAPAFSITNMYVSTASGTADVENTIIED